MSAPTLNYGWLKPVVGGDDGAWGVELNNDLDGIDSIVHGIDLGALRDAPASGGPYARQSGAWVIVSASGASITVADAAPTTASGGALWWDSSSTGGNLYVWFICGTPAVWDASPGPPSVWDGGSATWDTYGQWVDAVGGGPTS